MKIAIGVVLAVASTLVLACASSGGGSPRASCNLLPQDSVHLASGPVYRDCAVDAQAVLLNPAVNIDFRPTPRGPLRCHEVRLSFVVDARGVPEAQTARVLRTTDSELANAVIKSLPQYRYQAAQKDGAPVRQVVQLERKLAIGLVVVRAGSPPPRPPTC